MPFQLDSNFMNLLNSQQLPPLPPMQQPLYMPQDYGFPPGMPFPHPNGFAGMYGYIDPQTGRPDLKRRMLETHGTPEKMTFPNISKYINLTALTHERYERILQLAKGKGLDVPQVEKILTLYQNSKDVNLKMRVLALNFRPLSEDEIRFHVAEGHGFSFTENPDNSYTVECRTSSGFNTLENFKGDRSYFTLCNNISLLQPQVKSRSAATKRPLNSYMLYRWSLMRLFHILHVVAIYEHHTRQQLEEYLKVGPPPISGPYNPKFTDHSLLATVVSMLWNTEMTSVKGEFADFSKIEKEHHLSVWPSYKYRPRASISLDSDRELNSNGWDG